MSRKSSFEVTRRGFLSGAMAAAATGCLFTGKSPGEFDEDLAVLLADIHVSGDEDRSGTKGNRPHLHSRDWLKKRVAGILKMRPLPRNVIIFGDLAYIVGRVIDYKQSYPELKLLTDAGIKLTIGMGNHDHHSSFFEVWPEYVKRTLVPGQVVCTVEFPHADLVMIDSLNETAKPGEWNPVPGGFSKAMEEWVVESLPKWRRPFFVGAHHGFWELTYGAKKTKLCKLLCKCPNFRGYIHGHDHFWNTGVVDWHVRDTRPFMTLPSSGLWGDIGYVTFRVGPDKAVANLVEEDFFQPAPCEPEKRNPYWDYRIAEMQGRSCTFVI